MLTSLGVNERHKRAAPGKSLALLLSPANVTLRRSEQKPGGKKREEDMLTQKIKEIHSVKKF